MISIGYFTFTVINASVTLLTIGMVYVVLCGYAVYKKGTFGLVISPVYIFLEMQQAFKMVSMSA